MRDLNQKLNKIEKRFDSFWSKRKHSHYLSRLRISNVGRDTWWDISFHFSFVLPLLPRMELHICTRMWCRSRVWFIHSCHSNVAVNNNNSVSECEMCERDNRMRVNRWAWWWTPISRSARAKEHTNWQKLSAFCVRAKRKEEKIYYFFFNFSLLCSSSASLSSLLFAAIDHTLDMLTPLYLYFSHFFFNRINK